MTQKDAGAFSQANMDRLIVDYNARAESSRGRGRLSEDKIQTRMDALASSVQDMLVVFSGGELKSA
ncbi:hypothetical protein LPJ72_006416, partial [Coemansia sp. Benny D160-2]